MHSNESFGNIQPRLVNQNIAREYVGGKTVLQMMEKDGLKPVIKRHRLQRFDRVDLDYFINKMKLDNS